MMAFFTGMPGYLEVLIILFVALLLFGNRLPNVARSLAQGIVEFRKGLKGEPENQEEKKALPPAGGQQAHGIPQGTQGGANAQGSQPPPPAQQQDPS